MAVDRGRRAGVALRHSVHSGHGFGGCAERASADVGHVRKESGSIGWGTSEG